MLELHNTGHNLFFSISGPASSPPRPTFDVSNYSSPSCFRGYFSFCTSCSYSGERIDRSFTLFFLRKTTQKSRFSTEFFFLFFCEFLNFSFENLEISLRSTRYRRRNRKFRRYKRERTLPSCIFTHQSFLNIFEFLLQYSRSQGGSVFVLSHHPHFKKKRRRTNA